MPQTCGWLLALTLLSVPAAAQAPAGLHGTVRGQSGAPLAGITVVVSSSTSGVTRHVVTNADGWYALADLPPAGDYVVMATGAAFHAVERRGIALDTGEQVEIDFMLTVAAAERVRVGALGLPETASAIRQTIDETLTRDLPLFDRGFIQLSMLAPGFAGHPDYPDAQGQFYWTNNLLVDGASDYSKWRGAARSFYSGYGRESIRSVDVLPGLFAPDVGDGLASITMAATRSGGAAWHGSAFLFARDATLAATPVFAVGKPPGSSQQYGSSIGGPLRRDRVHLFASYDARRSRDRNIVSAPVARGVPVSSNQDERIAFVRIDGGISDAQAITARLNSQFFRWSDQPGGLVLPGSGTRYRNDAHTALLTHRIQVSPATLQEVRVQFARYIDRRFDLQPTVFVTRAGYAIEGGQFGPAGLGVDPEDTWEAHEALVHTIGAHSIRTGGTLRYVRAHATDSQDARGAYFFAGAPDLFPDPFLFIQGVAPTADAVAVDPRSVATAGFVQDQWQATPRLTVDAGVRYDVERVFNIRHFTANTDANNVQPRFGMAWTPGQSGMVIRAAAGLYSQQQVLYPLDEVQLRGTGGLATITLEPAAPAFPAYPATLDTDAALRAAPRDIYQLAPGFRNPYSLQAGAGIEQALRGFTLSAQYLRLDGHDLVSVVDANAPDPIVKPAERSVTEADATRPLVPVPSGYRKVLTIGNEGRSWYRALQIKASGATGTMHLAGAYTFAHAEDQANYLLPEDSNNLAAERGRASTDVRHNVAGAFTWQVPASRPLTRGWTLGAVAVFRSNRPYTITWGDDRNGTTQHDARPGARNTGRTGPYRAIDVSAARRASLGATSVEARVEVFNLLNTVNYDEYVGALLSPLFGRPISAFPPRRAQLAVILRF